MFPHNTHRSNRARQSASSSGPTQRESSRNESGITVLNEILKLDENAKIIMCSAMGQEKVIADALRKGAKDFIVKPFQEERLIRTIASITEQ